MPYIHFTQEQKDRAARTDLEVFLWSRGEKLLPSGRDKRLSSDHSVTIRGNHWFDHATHEGGNAISFVQRFTPICFMRVRRTTTAYSLAWMKTAQPDTRTCEAQQVRENPFVRPWRAATHDTAFTSRAAAKRSMSSSRPSTYCPISPCI